MAGIPRYVHIYIYLSLSKSPALTQRAREHRPLQVQPPLSLHARSIRDQLPLGLPTCLASAGDTR